MKNTHKNLPHAELNTKTDTLLPDTSLQGLSKLVGLSMRHDPLMTCKVATRFQGTGPSET